MYVYFQSGLAQLGLQCAKPLKHTSTDATGLWWAIPFLDFPWLWVSRHSYSNYGLQPGVLFVSLLRRVLFPIVCVIFIFSLISDTTLTIPQENFQKRYTDFNFVTNIVLPVS